MSDDWITEWLTPAQAAELIGLSRKTILNLVHLGLVQKRRDYVDGRRIMVNRLSVLSYSYQVKQRRLQRKRQPRKNTSASAPRCPTCTCLVDYHGQTCALCQFVAAGPYHRLRPMPVHPAAASNHDCRNHLENQ